MEYVHVDDWMNEPSDSEDLQKVKDWFKEFRKPAIESSHKITEASRVLCTYEGKQWHCIGASRMGDVWLTQNMDSKYGYEVRVNVNECSDWSIEPYSVARKSPTTFRPFPAVDTDSDKYVEAINTVTGKREKIRSANINYFLQRRKPGRWIISY